MKIILIVSLFSLITISSGLESVVPIFSCKQLNPKIKESSANVFEVKSGGNFTYRCDLSIDIKSCKDKPAGYIGCSNPEFKFDFPNETKKIDNRIIERIETNHQEDYIAYHFWVNISSVGKIHEGEYRWKMIRSLEQEILTQSMFRINVLSN